MSFGIVLVRFAVFLVPGRLVRTVTERLVFGKSAHANPDRLLLRFDFKRSLVRFYDSTHALSYEAVKQLQSVKFCQASPVPPRAVSLPGKHPSSAETLPRDQDCRW